MPLGFETVFDFEFYLHRSPSNGKVYAPYPPYSGPIPNSVIDTIPLASNTFAAPVPHTSPALVAVGNLPGIVFNTSDSLEHRASGSTFDIGSLYRA